MRVIYTLSTGKLLSINPYFELYSFHLSGSCYTLLSPINTYFELYSFHLSGSC